MRFKIPKIRRACASISVVGFLMLLAIAASGSLRTAAAARSEPPSLTPSRAMAAAAEPDAVPVLSAAEVWVERTLSGMTLRQRVAQLVFPWVPGDRTAVSSPEFQRMLRWVEQDEVGGLIISRGPPEAIASRLNAAQARAPVPLLVLSDLETGPSMRLSPGGTYLPPAMAFGAAGDAELARAAGRVTGAEARAVGIHMTLGPILDVNSNPRNPIINVRSFGEDPSQVARLAMAWTAGAREAGLLAAGKHFPGHGNTSVDSHVGLPTIYQDPDRLDAVELLPFRRTIEAGIEGILVGHIAVAGIDGPGAPPASLSARVVTDVLRDRLGFEGVVVTDALNMGAITRNYSVAEASIQAVLAGADILLQPPGTERVIDALVAAVESGRIAPARIEDAARRVLAAKAAAGLHRGLARVDPAIVRSQVGAAAHREVTASIATASMTLVRDRSDLVPLRRDLRRILHVVYSGPGGGSVGATLSAELRAGGFQVDHVRVSDQTGTAELAALRTRARNADLVLASAYVAPREYRALGLSPRFAALVEEQAASGKPVIAVSFGSPYIVDGFPSVPTYLLAWSAAESSQRAAARALLGAAPITGRLPVSLPPHHAFGEGIQRPGPGHPPQNR